ncbi:MAG TPA: class I SAM-dependent rRNA methyltransferase [Candidatus Bipolaricaulota bacterium]|nr:class I SAM-dependent rRNA methyltransferase [Candidatus Bipolaricaulota bacterium]
MNQIQKLTVSNKRVGPILARHPWIFSGAINKIPDGIESGAPVAVFDEQQNFLAQGYFNSYSQIAVRVWSYDEKEIVDDKFFEKRIKQAFEIRENYVENKKTDAFRIINSENDFLPGLIADKYGDYVVLQFHTKGIERWKDQILKALIKILKPKGIYERSDLRVREIEAGKKQAGLLYGKIPGKIKISENGFKFWVDVVNGQKTGFFLDQRAKRLALMKYVENKNVLNCFSYTGGFSVYALAAGAEKTVSVDSSASALELAKENIKLNKLDLKKCEFICEDAKKYLIAPQQKFDLIILDPPAFIKDRRKIKQGQAGYRSINEMAMKILPENGILLSCSCSAHLPLSDFQFVLTQAAARAKKTCRILETYTHDIDHLRLSAFSESEYLKSIYAIITD